jgi:hypothetical protein
VGCLQGVPLASLGAFDTLEPDSFDRCSTWPLNMPELQSV